MPQNGADITDHIYISPQLALEGGPYAYFHKKKSKKLLVKVPPGVRDGQRIRLAGMGEDGKAGGQPGNLYLKVRMKQSLLAKVRNFIPGLGK